MPQIWNIFVGDMSIIGPRPALWNQYDLIEERDRYGANDVLPGLTGWAQIHGRDELPIAKKAELDGYYVQHFSFRSNAHPRARASRHALLKTLEKSFLKIMILKK